VQLDGNGTVLRNLANGRIFDRPGSDAASGILFDPQGMRFPAVPVRPARDLACEALAGLKKLFSEFPFVDDASRSVKWSALLSSVARPAFISPRFAGSTRPSPAPASPSWSTTA
jgi:putative DNA primase/helicase